MSVQTLSAQVMKRFVFRRQLWSLNSLGPSLDASGCTEFKGGHPGIQIEPVWCPASLGFGPMVFSSMSVCMRHSVAVTLQKSRGNWP